MAAENFSDALKRVLLAEGGWSNHPADPGGVTLEGVIQRVYDADRKRRGLPAQRLTKAMRNTPAWIAERDSIYRRQYWNAVKGDELPIGVDYCVFDAGVNSGPTQAAKWLQRALKKVEGLYTGGVDGNIGVSTIEAANNHPNHDELVAEICRQRMSMLRGLRTWSTFGTGWTTRVNDVRLGAQAWATGARPPKATKIDAEDMAKADERDTKVTETPEGKSGADQVTTVTSLGLGERLMKYYDQASEYLSYYSMLPEWLARYVVAAVIVIAFAFGAYLVCRTVYGFLRIWLDKRAREKEQIADAEAVDDLAHLKAAPPVPRRKRKAKPVTRPRTAPAAKARKARS